MDGASGLVEHLDASDATDPKALVLLRALDADSKQAVLSDDGTEQESVVQGAIGKGKGVLPFAVQQDIGRRIRLR